MLSRDEQLLELIERVSLLEAAHARTEERKRKRATIALTGTWHDALLAVAKAWGLPMEMLRGDHQGRACSQARHAAIYILREHTDWSLPMIGRVCNRHHATVMYGIEKAERQMAKSGKFASKLALAKELFCATHQYTKFENRANLREDADV